MFDNYSLQVEIIFKEAEKEMLDLKHPYVGTEHILLSLLRNDDEVIRIFNKYGVTYKSFKQKLINLIGESSKKSCYILWSPLLKKVVYNSELKIDNKKEIKPLDILESLLEEDEGIAIRVLDEMDIDLDSIYMEIKNDKKSSDRLEIFTIGKNLQKTVNMDEKIFGRDEEITKIIEVLVRKNKNNPILIGEAGVGKTAIVEELARRINKGEVPSIIKDKIIVVLEMGSLVAGTKYRGEFEEKLNRIIKEVENNPNIILFIDEIHTLVNAGGAEGAINASDILKPYMARGSIKIIGATTINEYNKYILKDKALSRRMEVINILEPNVEQTINILKKIKHSYEQYYNIKLTDENIKTIVDCTSIYLKNKYNPDKSIAMLDLLCAKKSVMESFYVDNILNNRLKRIREYKNNMVERNDFGKALECYNTEKELEVKMINNPQIKLEHNEIINFVKSHCNIKTDIGNNELNTIKRKIKEKVVGQSLALNEIFKGLKNIHNNKLPSFLLKGEMGVGKTKTVTLLSEYLNRELVCIDMKEYVSLSSINKLIGVEPGYIGHDEGCIFDKIKNNPSAILLIKNIDEANNRMISLISEILDKRVINNTRGEIIDFSYSYIFIISQNKSNNKIGFFKHNNKNNYLKELGLKIDNYVEYKSINKEKIGG